MLALLLLTIAAPDTWAFSPGKDDPKAELLIDLRPLNEKVAGEKGFIKSDGSTGFAMGDGTPVRFWCVNSFVGREKKFVKRPRWPDGEPDLARHAKFLARRGVNMVRLHAHINPDPKKAITDIDEAERDWIWRSVAAFKKEGIYTTISPYFVLTTRLNKDWGVAGPVGASPFGVLFVDEKLQTAYKAWWKKLLTEKNPHTGVPLAKEPAVALLQLQNEDSLLFWTYQGLHPDIKKRLQKMFADWAAKKYGSAEKAKAAWGGKAPAELSQMWQLTQPGKDRRRADEVQFLTETMFDFNKRMTAYLRDDLGCKHMINAGNWKAADPVRLEDAERYSYTATDVLATNRYFGGIHTGKNAGWAVAKGDQFTRVSALKKPGLLPINLKQVPGKPILVTESGWVMPNGYGNEAPFLIAAYQSLTGVAGFYWFAVGTEGYEGPRSANGYLDSQAKWPIMTPDTLGQFPAAAYLYRKALVKKGEPVLVEERALEDLWMRRTPLAAESSGFDPNRDKGNLPPGSSVKQPLGWEAFLAGPVLVKYGGDPSKSKALDLKKFVKGNVIKSVTGEITLDHGKGVCVMDAPKAQGVAAFFDPKATYTTSAMTVRCGNHHAALLAVSLDGNPLKESGRVMVQFGGECRPSGWKEAATELKLKEGKFAGFDLQDHGKAPWRIEKADCTLTLKNAVLKRATVVGPDGRAAGEVKVKSEGGKLTLKFPPEALYVVLRK
jgi:hypothetical protein